MAEKPEVTKIVYNKTKGPVEMYAIDASHAVRAFPEEYSYEPWDGSEGPNLPNGDLRPVIPTDWVDLRPSERIDLARKLGGKDIRSGSAADDFINEYLVARANVGAVESDDDKPTAAPVAPAPLGPVENNPKD